MLSLSSAKAGSKEARGSLELPESGPEGVVCEARSEVREGGRRGVVGREGIEGLRVCVGVAILRMSLYQRFDRLCRCGGCVWRVTIRLLVFTLSPAVDDRLHNSTHAETTRQTS